MSTNKRKSRKEIAEENARFFENSKKWAETKNEASWKEMWFTIYNICLSLCKSKANGLVISDLESKALDAAILSMDLIKRGKGPVIGIVAWCSYQVTRVLYCKKQQEIDREYSFNDIDLNNDKFVNYNAEEEYTERMCPTEAFHKIKNTDYYIGEF